MTKAMRWLGYGLGGILLLLLLVAAVVFYLSERQLQARPLPRSVKLAAAVPVSAEEAHRRLYTAGCVSCHGEGLTGRKFVDVDGVFTIHASNVPMIASTASDEQLERAIRQGIGADGRPLFIMPSRTYQFMTDEEVSTLIAAVRALPVRGEEQPAARFGPLGRVALATGELQPMPALMQAYRDTPLQNFGAGLEKGRHLTQTVCVECHGPALTGQRVDPEIVAPDLMMVGAYDRDQFRTLLRTGVPPSGKDLGLMKEVSTVDFSHMTDAEIDAIHAYLVEWAQRRP